MKNPSSFNHLFNTNYAPSSAEIQEIKGLISEPEHQVRLLNEKISQLQAERDKVQGFIDDHRALLSPARRLPRDVIAEIFLRCLPTDRLPICSIVEAPLLLTSICRSWREVAITTPRLWRAIHFVLPAVVHDYAFDRHFQSNSSAQMDGFLRWLQRAHSVPLTISVFSESPLAWAFPSLSHTHRQELKGMYLQLMKILTQYFAQCKALYFAYLPLEIIQSINDVHGGEIVSPPLESLSLDNNSWDLISSGNVADTPPRPYPLTTFTNSLSLCALRIRSERFDPFSLPIAWDSLTELNIRPQADSNLDSIGSPVTIIHRLAQTCLSLQKCTLDFALLHPNFDAVNVPSQTWQSLSELKVYFRYQRNVLNYLTGLKCFCDAVTTPALSHFTFCLITSPYPEIEDIPAPFLGLLQSSFSLQSLDLDIPLSTKALIDCLGHVPLLRTLHLYDKRLSSAFTNNIEPQPPFSLIGATLQALTPKQPFTDAILCPLLEAASFRRCHLADTDAFIAFTEARLGQAEGAKLKSLNVTFRVDRDDMKLPDEELVKAERLKLKGIDVKWSSVGPFVSDAYDADSDRLMNPSRAWSASDGMPTLIGRPY